MLKILPFIRILYLKQLSSTLLILLQLKLEKRLFNNTFFGFVFHNKMIAHTAEKNQIKYFTQN